MTLLRYIVEPTALWLTWRAADLSAPVRTRRVVGLIYRAGVDVFAFRYLQGTADFEAAKDEGFRGFPAFDLRSTAEMQSNALEPFLRRMPPRRREDFSEYLAQHRLPSQFDGSDMALLGYTGALLPGDGFELVPVFPEGAVPLDYIAELAGVRHVFEGHVTDLHPGDSVLFRQDVENPVEPDAVIASCRGQRLGFVNRAMRKQVLRWLRDHAVTGTIDRVNGRPDRARVYVRIAVR
jgi:hypothetical protein